MKNIKKSLFRLSKRQLVAGGLVALLVTAGVLLLEGDWNRRVAAIDDSAKKAHLAAQDVLEGRDFSVDQLAPTETALNEVAQQSCDIPRYQQWRYHVSGQAEDWRRDCESLQVASKEAARSVSVLAGRLESERQIAQIVTDTMEALDQIDPQQYGEALKVWQQAVVQLESIEPDESMRTYVGQLAGKAHAITEAYVALEEASASASRPEYDDAHINLQNAYQGFASSSDEARASFRLLAEEVVTALLKL